MLAPDSFIDSDAQIGSADNRQASNVYLIGGVPVDQQQRFNSFWDQADEILKEYGFTEWQGYRTVGMPELVRRILEDANNNSDFRDDHKNKIGFEVGCFGQSRSLAINGVEEIQKKLLRIKYGLEKNDLTGTDRPDISQIEQADQKYAEEFRNFIARIRKIDIKAKKESIQDLLVSIHGGKSSLQGYSWGELSRVLAENSTDPYDEVATEPVQFIVDIPDMITAGSENYPSKDTARKLYEAFYRLYSEKHPGMLPPDEFMINFSISEYGIYSIVPLPW